MSESIERSLGELSANVKTLVDGQAKVLSRLEAHDRELSEARGAARANRWLIIAFPPAILAFWESLKAFGHFGGGHS